tara:strand:+ start:251 stop:469 length:219 start_codon:yes stop_codon:yes gene_type:complete
MTLLTNRAIRALNNLTDNWLEYEQTSYEEDNSNYCDEDCECEDVSEIPTDLLHESNYKDLRILIDYFDNIKK